MWSLGCVIAELFLGWPLYPGSSEYDQIRYICQTQGLPNEHMLNQATKTSRFFYRENNSNYPFWRLKNQDEHEAEFNIRSKESRKYIFNCLDDMAQVNVPTNLDGAELLAEKADRREFIDLLKRMLTLDQERRITPGEALNHSFVVLNHFVDYGHCSNVLASVKMMEVCRRRISSNSSSTIVNNTNHHAHYESNLNNNHQTMAIMNNFNSSTANVPTISFNNINNNNAAAAAQQTANAAAAAAAYQFHPSTNFYQTHNTAQSNATSRTNAGQQSAMARAAAISNQYAAVARAAVVAAAASSNHADPFVSHPGSSLCMPPILCPNPYQTLNSPAGKHPSMMPMAAAVQFQPSATFFTQMAAAATSGQQYVPVSVVEQNGRQMLLTNAAAAAAAIQSGWPSNSSGRQMFPMPPAWQQFQATAGRIQQPSLTDATDAWSRSFMLERAMLPEQAAAAAAAILPMEFHHDQAIYEQLRNGGVDRIAAAGSNLIQQANVFGTAPWNAVVAACGGQPTAAHQATATNHQYSASASNNGSTNINNQNIFSSTHNPNLFSAITGPSSLSKRNSVFNNLPNNNLINNLSMKPLKMKDQISPAKKRVKESSPLKWQELNAAAAAAAVATNVPSSSTATSSRNIESNFCDMPSSSINSPYLVSRSSNYEQNKHQQPCSSSSVVRNHQKQQQHSNNQHQTITIEDTPSPAVSVITISDSDDEKLAERFVPHPTMLPSNKFIFSVVKIESSSNIHSTSHYSKSNQNSNNSVSTTASVMALTPEEEYSRYPNSTSINKSSSMVFNRFSRAAPSSSYNLVHSYSTSAIVKNPNSNAIDADTTTTSAFTDSNYCQEGKVSNKSDLSFLILGSIGNFSQKKRILAKTQQSKLQQSFENSRQLVTKQESISNEDEDSLCGRVNHLSASGNNWNRPENVSHSFRHPKVTIHKILIAKSK